MIDSVVMEFGNMVGMLPFGQETWSAQQQDIPLIAGSSCIVEPNDAMGLTVCAVRFHLAGPKIGGRW
ncbi:hypothetical protein [Aeromonas veronii]|uniref:hypothetical protein n=1 Tax=Aeromonas TaxID=642 RepID=UPI0038F5A05E